MADCDPGVVNPRLLLSRLQRDVWEKAEPGGQALTQPLPEGEE
jgi:hypothetical protein